MVKPDPRLSCRYSDAKPDGTVPPAVVMKHIV